MRALFRHFASKFNLHTNRWWYTSALRHEQETQAAALQEREMQATRHEQENADLESELVSARYALSGLETQVAALQSWESRAQVLEANNQDLETRLEHSLTTLAGAEAELSKRNEEVCEWQQRANAEQEQKADAQKRLSAALESLEEKEADLMELNARMQDLCARHQEATSASQIHQADLQRRLEDELAAKTEEWAAQTSELEQRAGNRDREAAELRGQLEATLEKLAEKEAELLAVTARSQHVVREAALSWSPAVSRPVRSPGSPAMNLSATASPSRAGGPAGVSGHEAQLSHAQDLVCSGVDSHALSAPKRDERVDSAPRQVVNSGHTANQSMEMTSHNVTFEIEAVIRQSNEDLKEAQEQLAASQSQVASLQQELDKLKQDHERQAQMLHEARLQKDKAEAAQYGAQEEVKKKSQLWKEVEALEMRLEDETIQKERERVKMSQLNEQMSAIRSVVADFGASIHQDLEASAAQRKVMRGELQALRLLTDEAQRSHGEVVSSLDNIDVRQQHNPKEKIAGGEMTRLGTDTADHRHPAASTALELDREEKEAAQRHIEQLQAAAQNMQARLLVMQEALSSQSTEMAREKQLLVNAHATLQKQQDAAEARIESAVTARVNAAVKDAESRLEVKVQSLRCGVCLAGGRREEACVDERARYEACMRIAHVFTWS